MESRLHQRGAVRLATAVSGDVSLAWARMDGLIAVAQQTHMRCAFCCCECGSGQNGSCGCTTQAMSTDGARQETQEERTAADRRTSCGTGAEEARAAVGTAVRRLQGGRIGRKRTAEHGPRR